MKISFNDIAENKRWSLLFLAGLGALFFLGIGQTHLFDWDEINFAESAREMMQTGDYLRVQVNYEPFWEKPPFFIWMQVASMKVFGVNAFAARFPNAVFGILYLITIYLIGRKHFSPKFGLIWALVFCGSLLPNAYFKSGIIDPSFNFFIFLSIYFLIRVISGMDEEKKGRLAILSGIFSGLSVITKGPVGFLLLGLTLFVYLSVKRFKPFPKIKYILAFLVGLLGIIMAWLTIEFSQNGFEIIRQFIAYQAELFSSNVAGHEQPFYYHFVVVFFGCFPISIIAIPHLLKKRSDTSLDFHLWMLCLFWGVLILFSIVTTKIIHYSSMTWVPLSFIAAYSLYLIDSKQIKLSRFVKWGYLALGILISLVFLAVAYFIANNYSFAENIADSFVAASLRQDISMSPLAFGVGGILLVGTITGFIFLKKSNIAAFSLTTAGSVMVSLLIACYTLLPAVEQFAQGPAIAFYERSAKEDIQIVTFQYKSYGQYFYGKTEEYRNEMDWFLIADIEEPVYLVSKQGNEWLSEKFKFELVECNGGFCLYKRYPKNVELRKD